MCWWSMDLGSVMLAISTEEGAERHWGSVVSADAAARSGSAGTSQPRSTYSLGFSQTCHMLEILPLEGAVGVSRGQRRAPQQGQPHRLGSGVPVPGSCLLTRALPRSLAEGQAGRSLDSHCHPR